MVDELMPPSVVNSRHVVLKVAAIRLFGAIPDGIAFGNITLKSAVGVAENRHTQRFVLRESPLTDECGNKYCKTDAKFVHNGLICLELNV